MAHLRKVCGYASARNELLRRGADLHTLWRHLAVISVGAEFAMRLTAAESNRTRTTESRRKHRRRSLAKLTEPLRRAAEEITRLNKESHYDPRKWLSRLAQGKTRRKATLLEQVRAWKQDKEPVERLLFSFLELPGLLDLYAAYVESCFRHFEPPKRGRRKNELLNRSCIELVNYVRSATGSPHYYEVALLCQDAMQEGGMTDVVISADDLKKLYKRNPSLHKSSKPFR